MAKDIVYGNDSTGGNIGHDYPFMIYGTYHPTANVNVNAVLTFGVSGSFSPAPTITIVSDDATSNNGGTWLSVYDMGPNDFA